MLAALADALETLPGTDDDHEVDERNSEKRADTQSDAESRNYLWEFYHAHGRCRVRSRGRHAERWDEEAVGGGVLLLRGCGEGNCVAWDESSASMLCAAVTIGALQYSLTKIEHMDQG